jgi:S1-C subfamily serine protease
MEVLMIRLVLCGALTVFTCLFASHEKKDPIPLFDSVLLAKATTAAVVDVYAYRERDGEIFQPFELGDIESMLFGAKRHGNSSGTGCIISSDGYIVTCNHVVQDATRIFVGLNDGRKMQATKVFSNADADIAFLKIDTKNLSCLKLANSKTQIDLGEPVLVAGNAFGMGKTSIFRGLVSFINRVVDGKVVLQSDAHIGVGNSGGPMVNSMGEMIGMAFAIPRMGGLSFFIPASMIGYYFNKEILKKPCAWWGVNTQMMTPNMLESCGLEDKNLFGVIVNEIDSSSPAKSVLKHGDVIVEANGQKLSTPEELDFFEKTSSLEEEVTLKIWRENSLQDVRFIPIKEPKSSTQEVDNKLLGNVQFEQTPNGVIVKQAGNSGLFQEGDKVIALNKKKIKKLREIEKALKSTDGALSVTVDRKGVKISQSFSNRDGGSFFSQSIISGG